MAELPPPNSPPQKVSPPCPSTFFLRQFILARAHCDSPNPKTEDVAKFEELSSYFPQFSKFVVTSWSEFDVAVQFGSPMSKILIHFSTPSSHVLFIKHKLKHLASRPRVFFLEDDSEIELLQNKLDEAEKEAERMIEAKRKLAETAREMNKRKALTLAAAAAMEMEMKKKPRGD